ncbi:protein containing histidine kinase phosphotransfer (Hpt) region [Sulfurimonas gotlandica GD1]|jgi:chemotaxis protein histidine kinase CheA|uniref:Protein containing histidine kinase phosphotransfer (Hpt) region n=1 Tax=Sulfurimonas gotlandica (strain DSM 19862 / JCM 16533 / GD1) TaxID=929558 RepID=B6BIJ6_SULGG|nr:Hpt domain-containing protein [Sulfurimonas gotlandica]EDZ63317.1 putative CheA signal transduction histidine kinase [Sulfurimonas gotlandica GD1]EHP30351.1 protein containing histidine kinase phosphotransfer (Hpt) region [Sulfurimonas gotlandica GD1]
MGIRSDLDSNFDFEIVDEFLDHYSMMVESMEVMILDLEKPNKYSRSIDELFRVFHNIKSASGYLKIAPMAKLSAFVEDVLEELRKTHELPNGDIVTWLLAISDMYSQWQDDLKLDNNLSHIKYSLLKTPYLEK